MTTTGKGRGSALYRNTISYFGGLLVADVLGTEKERVKLVYRVKVDIPNPQMELKPGMPADAVIETN